MGMISERDEPWSGRYDRICRSGVLSCFGFYGNDLINVLELLSHEEAGYGIK